MSPFADFALNWWADFALNWWMACSQHGLFEQSHRFRVGSPGTAIGRHLATQEGVI